MTVSFSLFQPRIFDFFATGVQAGGAVLSSPEEFFSTAISAACKGIASNFDCAVLLSERRIEEARKFWLHDTNRLDIEASKDADHFKLCGFLAYWLRRRIVVDHTQPAGVVRSVEQSRFLEFSNEICAFMIAFQLATYFHFMPSLATDRDIAGKLKSLTLDERFLHDVATMLRHKNVSPHALYLIFAALFLDLKAPRHRNAIKLVRPGA